MPGNDEEEDYMSDAFLTESKETKGGQLSWGKTARLNKMADRRKAADSKNKAAFKPVKVREEEQRQKGLGSALSTESKGFALLQKMGYKQGTGLGKTGGGRAEPVGIEIKTGRGGLGREAEVKRKQQEVERMREAMVHKRARMDARHRGRFVQEMSSRFLDREVERDLHDSQKACAHLDQAEGFTEPEVTWYWPKNMLPGYVEQDEEEEEKEEDDTEKEEEEEEEEELPVGEKLIGLTKYLRAHHKYCVWCGTTFRDSKDLGDNCPGDSVDVHR